MNRVSSSVRAVLPLAALVLGACSEPAEVADAGPPSLELGTGRRDFESLQNGDSISIVQGPQGGYHFFGSLRARNIEAGDSENLADPANPKTLFAVYVGDSQVDAMASSYRQGLQTSGGLSTMVGRLVILDIADDSELDGATVRFVVTVEDKSGLTLSDERTLIAIPDPANR